MLSPTPSTYHPHTRAAQRLAARHMHRAIMETLEPRVLLSGSYLNSEIAGDLALEGLDKSGTIHLNGSGAISSGSWTNQDGSPTTQVVAGANSTYTVQTNGNISLTITTTPEGSNATTVTILNGAINDTRDIIALNQETIDSGTISGVTGLDILVNHSGDFDAGELGGTWNISAQDFRGTVTLNSSGHVVSGLLYLENNKHTAKITGGSATLNPDGTGTLQLTTAFKNGDSAFQSISLNLTMNNTGDVIVGNAANIGQPLANPQSGNTSAQLAVLLKTVGPYKSSDVVGTSWTLASATGAGSLTFEAGSQVAGSITETDGTLAQISGNYTLGGNGSLILNLTLNAGGVKSKESLFGALDRHKNVMALERAIANPGHNGSSLTVLINSADHAPTERAVAVWGQSAFQSNAVTFDFDTLLQSIQANDLDNDSLSLKITNVPAANGQLTITHGNTTTAVTSDSNTTMVDGDLLNWTPAVTAKAQVIAFSVRAFDGDLLAANPTRIDVSTSALPLITAKATRGSAKEALAGLVKGDGVITVSRAGGDLSQDLSVAITIGGDAVLGTNYTLLGPDGNAISSANATIVIPAHQNSATLTVQPLEDGVVDPTRDVQVSVVADPNVATPSYLLSVHPTAHVQILDSNPTVQILARVTSVREGNAQPQAAFIIERLPSQGGNLNGITTVTIAYSGSFDTENHLSGPTSITFLQGEVKKIIPITLTDDGVAKSNQTITATISGTGFGTTGSGHATVNVVDASPLVSIRASKPLALEAAPTADPGQFTVTRNGDLTNQLTVDFSTGTGDSNGTFGANYSLSDVNGFDLVNSVVILAGQKSAVINVTPIDDGINEGDLFADLTLQPDSLLAPSYSINNDEARVKIKNNDRFPTIANTSATGTTAANTNLQWSFDQLVTLTGASLATGSNGTLAIGVGKIKLGTLHILGEGQENPTAAHTGSLLQAGDTLIWTPPQNITGSNLTAFTLLAQDGVDTSLSSTLFKMTVTA